MTVQRDGSHLRIHVTGELDIASISRLCDAVTGLGGRTTDLK
ncbi:MAG TPA: hypothetical protein VLJ59_07225 [Mycobacteriales bacterium]|nr:hypothetical protein [Mycobacteriales bacterium]